MDTGSNAELSRKRWRLQLRESGLKCTEQRLAVLHELELARAPLSHREIMDRIDHLRWDPTTTFRNLNDLYEAGIVTRLDVGDRTWRFELLEKAGERSAPHAHFLCVACGAIECLPDLSIAETADQLHQLLGQRVIDDILVKGRCLGCVERSES